MAIDIIITLNVVLIDKLEMLVVELVDQQNGKSRK